MAFYNGPKEEALKYTKRFDDIGNFFLDVSLLSLTEITSGPIADLRTEMEYKQVNTLLVSTDMRNCHEENL